MFIPWVFAAKAPFQLLLQSQEGRGMQKGIVPGLARIMCHCTPAEGENTQ